MDFAFDWSSFLLGMAAGGIAAGAGTAVTIAKLKRQVTELQNKTEDQEQDIKQIKERTASL